MSYTYTPNVPDAATPMNITQPQILENFQAIQELVAVNHVGFNTTNFGAHNFLTMPNTTTPAVTGATDLNVYTKATGSPNASEIFGLYPTGVEFQISGLQTTATGTSGTGWSKYPSGIIMKWGTFSFNTSSQNGFVVFPTGSGIPAFTQSPSYIKVTSTTNPSPIGYAQIAGLNTYGPTQFLAQFNSPVSSGTVTFNWFAIGI